MSEALVFLKRGDATAEVEALLGRIRAGGGSPEDAGFLRYFFVTQAMQTVVMVAAADAPFAAELRTIPGWLVPVEQQEQPPKRRR